MPSTRKTQALPRAAAPVPRDGAALGLHRARSDAFSEAAGGSMHARAGADAPSSRGFAAASSPIALAPQGSAQASITQTSLPPTAASGRGTSQRPRLIGWVLPLSVLALWELAAHSGILRSHLLPAPSIVLASLVELQQQGVLFAHVAATCLRVLAGFALGALAGTLLGIVTGRNARACAVLDPTLQALRSIPSLAWVPLFLLWLGIQETSKVALIAVGVFFPVYLNLMSGIRSIDPGLLEVAEMFQYRGTRLARHVLLPAALPAYITGLRSGLGLGWMFVVAAELMGASRGLGYLMVDGQTTSRPELIMGAILLFALLGKLSDQVLARISAWGRGPFGRELTP